ARFEPTAHGRALRRRRRRRIDLSRNLSRTRHHDRARPGVRLARGHACRRKARTMTVSLIQSFVEAAHRACDYVPRTREHASTKLKHARRSSYCLSMIFFGKPVSTFPDHALGDV